MAAARRCEMILVPVLVALGGCAARSPSSPARAGGGDTCSEKAPAACEAACFRGDGAACAIFGAALEGMADPPVRLPQDLPRGRKALDKGCKLGNLDACRVLISYDSDVTPPGTACAGWEALCKRGDPRSCSFLGGCLSYSEHFRRDPAEARRLLEEGCAHGERVACRDLAFVFLEGEGVPVDISKGFELIDRACRMDDPTACAREGRQFERGQGVPRDLERAKALYRGACARGVMPTPCEGLRRLGEVPPPRAVSSADAAESNFASARFDWEWRIPANWKFVPPATVSLSDAPTGAEVVAARPRDAAVRDSLTIVASGACPERFSPSAGLYAKALDDAEHSATRWLAGHGISKPKVLRKPFWGDDAVRIEARAAPADGRFLTMSLVCKFKKLFEVRCLSEQPPADLPCRDAFGALTFWEPKRGPDDYPRVIHVREKRFGFSFDAPDDTWLGFGPREVENDVSWNWYEGDRRIDLRVLVMEAVVPAGGLDRFVGSIENSYRQMEASVTRKQSEMGGQPCAHLVIDKMGHPQDFFFQVRGNAIFTLTVSAPKRDPELLAKVLAGFRSGVTP